jgi:hypothetical protein
VEQSKILEEGLRTLDLKDLVYPIFEVDTYKSKMGEDQDVCVISFQVKDRSPARDLMEFIEKGFSDVLDADVSAGENDKGEYSVFVELNRSPRLAEQIKELLYGVRKLTGIEEFKFKYHKVNNVYEVSEETLKNIIPSNPIEYQSKMLETKTNEMRNFFSKTLMDDLSLDGDVVTIHKPFNQKIQMRIVREGNSEKIIENTEGHFSVDESATSEVLWLTKVLGNYDISKLGENFLFTNGEKSMLLQRMEK